MIHKPPSNHTFYAPKKIMILHLNLNTSTKKVTCVIVFLSVHLSVSAGHQHEESVQELHPSGPAGGVQEQHTQLREPPAHSQRTGPTPWRPHRLQVTPGNCSNVPEESKRMF